MLDIFKYSKNFSRDINILWLVHRTLRDDFTEVDEKILITILVGEVAVVRESLGAKVQKPGAVYSCSEGWKILLGRYELRALTSRRSPREKKSSFLLLGSKSTESKKDSFQKWEKVEHKFKIDFRAGIFFQLRFALCQNWGKEAENLICGYWNANIQLV